jgi:hypothetical protein
MEHLREKRKYFKEFEQNILYRLVAFFEEQRDKNSLEITPLAKRVEPARGERQRWWLGILYMGIVLLLVIGAIACGKYVFSYLATLKAAEKYVSWESSISSFLGTFLGAIVSGLAAVWTTYLVINRSYKMDYHNERMSIMPIFMISAYRDISQKQKDYYKKNYKSMIIVKHDILKNEMFIVFENVGKGIAFDVSFKRYYDDWEGFYLHTMQLGDEKAIAIYYQQYNEVLVTYKDIYDNQYQQYFQISIDNESIEIFERRPELVMRTKRARYTQ